MINMAGIDEDVPDLLSMTNEEAKAYLSRRRNRRDVPYYFTHNNKGKAKQRKKTSSNSLEQQEEKFQSEDIAYPANDDGMEQTSDVPPEEIVDDAPETSIHISLDMDAEQKYAHLLSESQGYVFTSYAVYISRLKDNGQLNEKSYVAIVRLAGDLHCSCSSGFELAMTACRASLSVSQPTQCLHLRVTKRFCGTDGLEEWVYPVDRILEEHDYSSKDHFEVTAVNHKSVVVYHDRNFATVCGSRCDCSGHNGPCRFIPIAQKDRQEDDSYDLITRYRQVALSWKKIPFFNSGVSEISEIGSLSPTACECGSTDVKLSTVASSLSIYGLNLTSKCIVYSGKCSQCPKDVYVDGADAGVLNMSHYLVTHALLRRYQRDFLLAGKTIFQFWKEQCWEWTAQGCEDILRYSQLRLSWLSYLDLLDYDSNQSSSFSCPLCLAAPDIVVCDGITLSLQKRFLTYFRPSDVRGPILHGSRYDERILIREHRIRKQLRTMVTVDSSILEVIQQEEPWLAPILLQFNGHDVNDLSIPWRSLIRDISAATPAIGLVSNPSAAVEVLGNIQQVTDMQMLQSIKEYVPSVYSVLRDDIRAVELIRPMLQVLVRKIAYIMSFSAHDLPPISASDSHDTMPSLPQLVERGRYKMDKKKAPICSKRSPRHKTLIPGIFTINCLHGVCYGFQLMDRSESPDVPFTLLRTRFPKAPSMVIYDNGCNLHDYCLNRDPGFFADTKFFVDRFHWHNHKDCSSGYRISSFLNYDAINTEVAEQVNAKLARLRSLVSYCNEENFVRHVLFFLWYSNTCNILNLLPPNNKTQTVLAKFRALVKRR